MAARQPIPLARKSLAENALCFGCAVGALTAAAVALQWALSLLT